MVEAGLMVDNPADLDTHHSFCWPLFSRLDLTKVESIPEMENHDPTGGIVMPNHTHREPL